MGGQTRICRKAVGPVSEAEAEWAGGGRWHTRLRERFRERAEPLLCFEEGIIPAASLWTGARLWLAAFRGAGLKPGDRLVMALPASPAFLQVLIAALWDDLTLALARPTDDVEAALETLDAKAGVTLCRLPGTWLPEYCSGPVQETLAVRPTRLPPTPDARLLLRTSGTTGEPRWIAFSDRNLLSVLDSHAPLLALSGARILSVLPWNHAFGLLIDLFPALFSGAEIVREPSGGRDTASILAMLRKWETTHLCSVPLVIQRLAESDEGRQRLRLLRGGVVGGAAVSSELADFLSGTRLRAGYGQTEASPGIALGAPGVWRAGYLGRPVGCRVRLDAEAHLHFAGANACLGAWEKDGLIRLDPERWVDTRDLARQEGDDLTFLGRAEDDFKLANGRCVQAGVWETLLRERIPAIQEALLFSPDGQSLTLCLARRQDAKLPAGGVLRETLGPLGARLSAVRETPPEAWVRTSKGSIDRQATLHNLTPHS